jgi:hypothetical protein
MSPPKVNNSIIQNLNDSEMFEQLTKKIEPQQN